MRFHCFNACAKATYLTAPRLPVRRVDRLVVWNDLMRDQAIDLHGYRPDEIRVAGVPQFDGYFRGPLGKQPGPSRDAFFRTIGADPSRRLITVTTTPRSLYAHHDHVLRVLMAAVAADRFPRPAQVLVRLHPRDEIDAHSKTRQDVRVTLNTLFPANVTFASHSVSLSARNLFFSSKRFSFPARYSS